MDGVVEIVVALLGSSALGGVVGWIAKPRLQKLSLAQSVLAQTLDNLERFEAKALRVEAVFDMVLDLVVELDDHIEDCYQSATQLPDAGAQWQAGLTTQRPIVKLPGIRFRKVAQTQ